MKIPTAMDDSSVSHHNGGQVGSQIGVSVNNKQNDEPSQSVQYSIPGILHFIQHEWARFELERSQWEVDRAEFKARIAFLEGERKGQENLKNDLVRRIKMLEYALKQERAKFHKLKYGVELQQGDVRPPPEEPTSEPEHAERAQWKQGRQLIKQYLQEIGYTDTILDVRSNRVRALLGLNNEEIENPNYRNYDKQQHDRCDYSMNHMVRKYDYGGKEARKSTGGGGYNEEGLSVQETAAVFANFEFLTNQEMDMDEIDDLDAKQSHHICSKKGEDLDLEAEEVLNELSLITEREADGGGQGDEYPVGGSAGGAGAGAAAGAGAGEADEEPLALGELAQLTVSNEPEAYDVASANKESFRKTWNAKYTLRSHFDGVRALAFHPTEAALVTASEDHTLKLWNLQRTVPAKKSAGLDVEPLYTFRAHTAPVLCLAMGAPRSEECFSGGLDGTIRVWNLPPPTADPYDPYDPAVQGAVLRDHTDAVWSLAAAHGRLLSASGDGTVRLWAPRAARPLLATLRADESPSAPAPAAADFADAAARAAVAYRDGSLLLYDLETGQVGGAARGLRGGRDARARAPDAAAAGDGARGPPHPLLGRGVGPLRARHGGAPGRRHGAGAGPQRAVPAVGLARLLRAPVEPRHEDVRAGDHGAPQEVRREHPGRGVPPAAAVHRERGRGRARQGVRVSARDYIYIVYILHVILLSIRTLCNAVASRVVARRERRVLLGYVSSPFGTVTSSDVLRFDDGRVYGGAPARFIVFKYCNVMDARSTLVISA